MATVLATMKVHADEFRRLEPPAGYEDIDVMVEEMAAKMDGVAENMATGIDTLDTAKIGVANQGMIDMTALAGQITQKLQSR